MSSLPNRLEVLNNQQQKTHNTTLLSLLSGQGLGGLKGRIIYVWGNWGRK